MRKMTFDRFIYITGLLVLSFNLIECGSVNVETGIGTIIGSKATVKVDNVEFNLKTFLGIPYARPPVGDLRFRKPEPMPRFDSPFEAANFGQACPQPEFPGMPVYNQSEDCLFLNVYVPEQTPDMESGHAVMLFIHGGGFTMGAGETYPGEELCSFGNVIVVTINYRLGVFGLLASGDDKVSGNFAFHDQHLALKWVNANIGAFGGDNNRVTIFGESAGGSSVVIQSMYPSNKGLIHRVISQSGALTIYSLIQRNPGQNCLTLAKELGCEGTSINDAVSCIKATSVDTIMKTMQEVKDPQTARLLQFLPTVDDEIIKIPLSTISSLSKTENLEQVEFFRSLDFISGVTNLEGGVFLLVLNPLDDLETFVIQREDFLTQYVPTVLAMACEPPVSDVVKSLVIAEYTNWTNPNLPENNRDQYLRLAGDVYFTVGSVEISALHSNVSGGTQNTYAYLFRAKPTNHVLKTPTWFRGANHGDDVAFVFIFPQKMIDIVVTDREIKPITDWEYQLAYDTATYWTNFAKSGNPNAPVDVPTQWPKYEPVNQQYLILDKDMSEQSTGSHLYAREANLWLETIPEVTKAMAESHDHDSSSPFAKKSTDSGSCSADGKCEGD